MTTYTLPLSSNTIDLLANSSGYNVQTDGVYFPGDVILTTNLSDPLPFDYYDILAADAYNIATSSYNQANTATNLAQTAYDYANTIGGGAGVDNVARTLASSASSNTIILQGIDVAQNTRMSIIESVDVTQNTRLGSIETINSNQNTSISIIQAVDITQNTRLGSIETVDVAQNTSISIIQGVDVTQNAQITAINQFVQAAYNQANTANSTASTSVDSFARTTANGANGLAQGAYNKANTALANTTGTLSGSLYITGALGVGTAASGTTGEIRATNEITAYYSSDERLKENIQKIDDALYKLRTVRGVMFDWKDEVIERRGGEDKYFVRKHDTGIIAQEIEQILPEVVATREDGYKAVRYEKLAGLIVQAINELADEVDEIKQYLKMNEEK
jgi:hypothetical protein